MRFNIIILLCFLTLLTPLLIDSLTLYRSISINFNVTNDGDQYLKKWFNTFHGETVIDSPYLDDTAVKHDPFSFSTEFAYSPDDPPSNCSEINGIFDYNPKDVIRDDLDEYDSYKFGMTQDDHGYPHKYSPVYMRIPESGSVLDTMPDLPEKLIYFIAYHEPGLFEYITKKHAKPSKFVLNMEPEKIEYLCKHVPQLGKLLAKYKLISWRTCATVFRNCQQSKC